MDGQFQNFKFGLRNLVSRNSDCILVKKERSDTVNPKSKFQNPKSRQGDHVMAPPEFPAWYRMVSGRVLNLGTRETTIPAKAPNGQR